MAKLNRSASGTPYDVTGTGTPAFLFLAERGGADRWAAQVADLARTNQCILTEARDIDAVAHVLGEERPGPVVLAASGESSLNALHFFEHFPEAVTGVVLFNPPFPPGDDAERPSLEALVRIVDKKPFMVVWPEQPAGDPAWLRDVTMFVRQEPVAGAPNDPRTEQPAITNALLRAMLDDVKNDPRLV